MEQAPKAEQDDAGEHLDPGDVSELELFGAETDDQKEYRCSRDGCERQGAKAQCAQAIGACAFDAVVHDGIRC